MSLAIAYKMKKKKHKGGEETTRHVPVTKGEGNSFGDTTYVVEHKDGSKKHFSAQEGGHEDARRQAEEYRRKNLKMSHGGSVELHEDENPVSKGMKKAFGSPMASGGDVKNAHHALQRHYEHMDKKHGDQKLREHDTVKYLNDIDAKMTPQDKSKQAKLSKNRAEHTSAADPQWVDEAIDSWNRKKKPKKMAHGGEITDEDINAAEACENCGHMRGSPMEHEEYEDDDMINSIMEKRKGYSEGGRVANDTDFTADTKDAEYDDLVKDDDLEFSYNEKNSGDDEGNAQVEDDEDDTVSQIMKSRKKKDKLPRPA